MHPVEEEFSGRGIQRGGILFLEPGVALEMIGRCRQCEVLLTGIDGFQVTDAVTKRSAGHSVDLSNVSTSSRLGDSADKTKRLDAAEKFLRGQLESGLYFDVVVDNGD